MATIILEPGEVFKHYHVEASQSVLLEGQVRFQVGDRSQDLVPGEPVEIPPRTAHSLQNTGTKRAAVQCSHS